MLLFQKANIYLLHVSILITRSLKTSTQPLEHYSRHSTAPGATDTKANQMALSRLSYWHYGSAQVNWHHEDDFERDDNNQLHSFVPVAKRLDEFESAAKAIAIISIH
jgi:hypothetical protein